jgi:hypothetical protein
MPRTSRRAPSRPRFAAALGAALTLVLAASALGAGPDSRAELLAREQGKGTCPRGQVAVVLDGRKACQPLARALPPPRSGDERLSILGQLLTSTWGSPPDSQGRKPPTIEQLVSDFGPSAAARVRKAIAQIPATVDRLNRPKARALSAATSAAASRCGPSKGTPKVTDTKREDLGNGSAFDVTFTLGDGEATVGFGIEGKAKDGSDRKVRWDAVFDLCEENLDFSVPECPTAEGKLDGAGRTSFSVKVSSIRDGKVEHSATVEIKHRATSKGTVAVDAKLDRVEIEDVYTSTMRSTGQSILWGPSSEKGTVSRRATIDMRTGRYDPGTANVVDVQVSYTGILSIFVQDALAKARVAGELKKASDETFARTVRHAIDEYRKRERAWQTPNTCAELEFTPASRTLRLRNGQTGSLKAAVKAKRGGTAKDGRWRRGAQRNVSVSPAQASGAKPTFSYRVTNADRVVSASFRATSPAGVAAGTWVQGGEEFPARFSGTFSGENRTALKNTYSGTISFARERDSGGVVSYRLERVSWTHRVSPLPGSPCSANASAQVTATANGTTTLGVLVVQKGRTAKGYGYAITASFASPRQLTIDMVCNGAPVKTPWVPGGALNTGPPGSGLGGGGGYTDGKVVKGRYESTGTASTYTWNLKGSG